MLVFAIRVGWYFGFGVFWSLRVLGLGFWLGFLTDVGCGCGLLLLLYTCPVCRFVVRLLIFVLCGCDFLV